jgi:hypothetical protein
MSLAWGLSDLQLACELSSLSSKKRNAPYSLTHTSKRRTSKELELQALVKRSRTSSSGMAQLVTLIKLLDSFGLKRSRVQQQLHLGMVGSVLARIFEHDSDAEVRAGMFSYGIESQRQQFMAITPRRFGKTTVSFVCRRFHRPQQAVAMFVAAFALAVPGSVTAIFSTGRRASNLLLQQIKSMILCIPGAEAKIASSNVETIHLRDGAHLSKISSFPGMARTLRGTGGDLIILEVGELRELRELRLTAHAGGCVHFVRRAFSPQCPQANTAVRCGRRW